MASNELEISVENETEKQFNLDSWCSELQLSRKVTQILRREDIVTCDVIRLLTESDLKQIGVTLGAIKVIMTNIKTNQDNASSEVVSNHQMLQAAGKAFDNFLSASTEKLSMHSDMFMDPRTILTIKSVNKKAKCRHQNKRREYVLSGSGDR
ncbi:hypothetical protein DPMN_175622 [Dreissena polymorpha]|uniref:SAM domain-containing protein n=1 Tax=Dreissena polymorpha TaxID=45954 RepID=A0A9D4IG79_DREPO|nr:hypothetical protein DPMN_175622 [Dreissena polymorpha]